jgi:hypothetical protein
VVPDASIELAESAGPDIRDYRVDCSKINGMVPAFRTEWTVEKGARELVDNYRLHGLTEETFFGPLSRIAYLKDRMAEGSVGADLRRVTP